MTARDAVQAFDEISEVYDQTREPPSTLTLDRLGATLRTWDAHRLLEVGVGTGRMAIPLRERGFDLTGLDGSIGMLRRARAKNVVGLVRGDAYRLPFHDDSFDLAIFVHVLHVLDDAGRALREARRVGRLGAAALVEPAGGSPRSDRPEEHPRQMVYDILRREGISVPSRAGAPRFRERALLQDHPPDRVETLVEEDVTEPVSRELDFLGRRASRWTLDVPPDALERAVAEVRAKVGDRTRTYHRVQALALWSSDRPV